MSHIKYFQKVQNNQIPSKFYKKRFSFYFKQSDYKLQLYSFEEANESDQKVILLLSNPSNILITYDLNVEISSRCRTLFCCFQISQTINYIIIVLKVDTVYLNLVNLFQ